MGYLYVKYLLVMSEVVQNLCQCPQMFNVFLSGFYVIEIILIKLTK